jgi:hypothetical protein
LLPGKKEKVAAEKAGAATKHARRKVRALKEPTMCGGREEGILEEADLTFREVVVWARSNWPGMFGGMREV